MGLLDAVSGLLNESTGGGNAPDLMSIASQLLDSNAPGGGLAGLVQHFRPRRFRQQCQRLRQHLVDGLGTQATAHHQQV